MKQFLFLLLSFIFLNCANNHSNLKIEQNVKSISDEEIKKAAVSFHAWYIKSITDEKNVLVEMKIIEGENGKCQVDYNLYLNELRKLGTVSEKFITSEKLRMNGCADKISDIDWKEFKEADAYAYEEFCDFIYYYYWIKRQEPVSGVEAGEIERQDNGKIKVVLKLYDEYKGQKQYYDFGSALLAVENNKLMIVDILIATK